MATTRAPATSVTVLVLVGASVGMTLVTGLIYTFSTAIMPNLAEADDRTFVEITQRFNQNPVFPLTFTAALVLLVLAAVLLRRPGPSPAARWTITALVLYGVVLAVTFGINVPLNEEIDRAGDPGLVGDLAQVRDDFEGPWVVANLVRMAFSIASVGALARALLLVGLTPPRPSRIERNQS